MSENDPTQYSFFCENRDICELLVKYIHDIVNMNPLDAEMIENIRHMPNEEKMLIIIVLNRMVQYLITII